MLWCENNLNVYEMGLQYRSEVGFMIQGGEGASVPSYIDYMILWMGDSELKSGSISHFRNEECVGVYPHISTAKYGS